MCPVRMKKEEDAMPEGKKERATTTDRESPTYAGLMLSLRAFRHRLKPERGLKLNVKSRELDVLIIDDLSPTAERMDNAIAYFFERHNLVELKNPNEPLTLWTVWKGISYATQYISENAISHTDVTFTFLRLSKPYALLKELAANGFTITQDFIGVYYVRGMTPVKVQIVVGNELTGDDFVPLRAQKKNTSERDAEKLLALIVSSKQDPVEINLVESVLQASILANNDLYEKLRREMSGMCDALRELMREDFEAVAKEATKVAAQNTASDIIAYMADMGFGQDVLSALNTFKANQIKALATV